MVGYISALTVVGMWISVSGQEMIDKTDRHTRNRRKHSMIVLRCPQCDKRVEIKEPDKENEYTELTASVPCCNPNPNTPEEKLLKAIFGKAK